MARTTYRGPVYLHHRDGTTRVFPTREAAFAALRLFGCDRIAVQLRTPAKIAAPEVVLHYDAAWNFIPVADRVAQFVLRDEAGNPLTDEDFSDLAPPRSTFWSRRWDSYRWNGEGPVPGTAKRSGHYGWFRHPHTQNERRQNALVLAEEGEAGPRPARRPRSLPTSWDDYGRHVERCWKRQRRTQWRQPTSARPARQIACAHTQTRV